MKTKYVFLILITLIFTVFPDRSDSKTSLNPAAVNNNFEKQIQYKKNEILVKFKSNLSSSRKKMLLKKMNASQYEKFSKTKIEVIKLTENTSVKEAVEYFKNQPEVEYAEPNYKIELDSLPNDVRFSQEWNLSKIEAPKAWDKFTGDSNLIVATLDSGIDYTHEDLIGNLWINSAETVNSVDDDNNGYIDDIYGINAIINNGNPMDDNGHGTLIAGIIGAVGNNSKGIAGINWNVKLMALKFVAANGSGYVADAIKCIDYILDMKARGVNIKVVNNSWGNKSRSKAFLEALQNLRKKNIILVCSAGNDGMNNDDLPKYPASFDLDNIISVAATKSNDEIADFSNYGVNSVDVAGPGVGILSTYYGGGYIPKNGDLFFDDIESGAGNWIHSGTNDSWSIKTEAFWTPFNSWSDSPLTDYALSTDSYLTYNSNINLSGTSGKLVKFAFYAKVDLEDEYDFLYVEISKDGGLSWDSIGSLTGKKVDWKIYSYFIPENYRTDQFRVRFNFKSDDTLSYDGVHIDNIGIGIGSNSNEYDTSSGTSFSAAHVSGQAALLWGYKPDLTYIEVIDIIFASADKLPQLENKVLTGGRINLNSALNLDKVNLPPVITGISPTQGPEGVNVIIKGRRFESQQGSVIFSLNKTSSILTWTDTTIVCTVPAGAVEGSVTVTTLSNKISKIYFKAGNYIKLYSFIPTPVNSPSIANVGNKIYIIGGFLGDGKEETDLVQIFDYEKNYWTYGSSKPTSAGNSACAVLNNKIYVFGGLENTSKTTLNIVEFYDPLTDTWNSGIPIPQSLSGAVAVAFNGKIYLSGGNNFSKNAVSAFYEFNSNWNVLPSMNSDRASHGMEIINGKIYVFGGIQVTGLLTTAEVYDISTAKWVGIKSLNTARYDMASGVYNNKIYTFGGNASASQNGFLNNIEIYDPIFNEWNFIAKFLNKAKQGQRAVSINDNIFIAGGYNGASMDQVESLNSNETSSIQNSISITSLTADLKNGIVPVDAVFAITAKGGSGIYSFLWDFGDGSSKSTEQNPKHTYSIKGNYNVNVSVQDAMYNEIRANSELIINIFEPLSSHVVISAISANPVTGIIPLESVFFVIGTGGSGNYKYEWDFGDGSSKSSEQNPKHIYSVKGNYNVKVTVTDLIDSNNYVTSYLTIIAFENEKVNVKNIYADPVSGDAPLEVSFSATGSGGSGAYLYEWDFGDGSQISEEQNIKHKYETAGTFLVSLKIRDTHDLNNFATGNMDINVKNNNLNIILSISPVTGEAPLSTNFLISIKENINKLFKVNIEFGDSTRFDSTFDSLSIKVKHIYQTTGKYKAIMTVMNSEQTKKVSTETEIIVTKKQEPATKSSSGKKGICLISKLVKRNAFIGRFRDSFMMNSETIKTIIKYYYKLSAQF